MDPKTLSVFRRDIPIICLDDEGPNYLIKILTKMGFTNINAMQDQSHLNIGPFSITMYKPFVNHPFFESDVGNLVDSAIVVEADGQTILNTNDNTPDEKACYLLKDNHDRFDVAQLNYNAAGPYPACFENLTLSQKMDAHDAILKRNIEHLRKIANILKPSFVQPFAGAYVLGGKNYHMNVYLGTITQDEAASRLTEFNVLLLDENNWLDIDTGSLRWPYAEIDKEQMAEYILEELKTQPYPYDREPSKDLIEELPKKLERARETLWFSQERLGMAKDRYVVIDYGGKPYVFNFADWFSSKSIPEKNFLWCKIHPVLLNDILERKAHWNNAEIGCHIGFIRKPDVYDPDVHTMLSFFHL